MIVLQSLSVENVIKIRQCLDFALDRVRDETALWFDLNDCAALSQCYNNACLVDETTRSSIAFSAEKSKGGMIVAGHDVGIRLSIARNNELASDEEHANLSEIIRTAIDEYNHLLPPLANPPRDRFCRLTFEVHTPNNSLGLQMPANLAHMLGMVLEGCPLRFGDDAVDRYSNGSEFRMQWFQLIGDISPRDLALRFTEARMPLRSDVIRGNARFIPQEDSEFSGRVFNGWIVGRWY